jgi:hypothetical protein
MEHPPASWYGRLRPHAVPAAVLLTGIVCAATAAAYVERAVGAQQEARFRAEVAGSVDAIRSRMEAYVAMLRAARGLVEGIAEAERARALGGRSVRRLGQHRATERLWRAKPARPIQSGQGLVVTCTTR